MSLATIQDDLEARLLLALKALPALRSIVTFEDDVRDCLFTESKLTQGFESEELPALNLSASLDPTVDTPFTCTETQHDVPISIVVIANAETRKLALRQVKAYQEAISALLDTFRRSGNSLGFNALLMGDISSSAISIQDDPLCFATGTTGFKITKIT